ncbi:MAG: hypothetical protein R3B13_27075 [Polyangiaceae bacterium]
MRSTSIHAARKACRGAGVVTAVRLLSFACCSALALLAGCRRGPNLATLFAVHAAQISSDRDEQTAFGFHGKHEVAHTDAGGSESEYARIEVKAGANRNGVLGALSGEGQLGVTTSDDPNAAFIRGGARGTLETDPVSGMFSLELPTLFAGYQHHGKSLSDQKHFDVGPRASFGLIGNARSDDRNASFVAAPIVGAGAIYMATGVTASVSYDRVLESAPLDLVRGSACMLLLLALCVEVRHVQAAFSGERSASTYLGFSVGVGLAHGEKL